MYVYGIYGINASLHVDKSAFPGKSILESPKDNSHAVPFYSEPIIVSRTFKISRKHNYQFYFMENLSEVYLIFAFFGEFTMCTLMDIVQIKQVIIAIPLTSSAEPQGEPRQPPWNERNGAAT
jgi:hypothetical protein